VRAPLLARVRGAALALPLLLAALLEPLPAGAQGAPGAEVPLKLQAALFNKIFAYDPALKAGAPRVLVVHPEGGAARAKSVVAAFHEAGVIATAAPVSEAAVQLGSVTVLYALDGAQPVLGLAAQKKVLCISGTGRLAERGDVAVGLAASAAGKPEIIVHRTRLRAEGHELSANLLRLARVVQ
jgi:hypothetical protein